MPLKSDTSQVWIAKAFNQFTGVDTGEPPSVIGPDKLAWLVNYIPTGTSTLRKIPGYTNITFLPNNKDYIYMYIAKCTYNFAFILAEDGSLHAMNLDTNLFHGFVALEGTLTPDAKMVLWTLSGEGVLLIIDPVKGYFSWKYGDTYISPVTVLPVGQTIKGTDIEVYSSRVWIADGRNIFYSNPESYSDFSIVPNLPDELGVGGVVAITSPNLTQRVVSLNRFQDYLYVFGDHSLSTIQKLTITTSTSTTASTDAAATTFSLTEIFSHLGAINTDAQVFFQSKMIFDSGKGLYAMVGFQPERISDELDGFLPTTFNPISFSTRIFGVPYFGYLCGVSNPVTSMEGVWIALMSVKGDLKRWTFVDYGRLFTCVASLETETGETTYGVYGNFFCKLFDESSTIETNQWLRTRADDFGFPVNDKSVAKLGIKVTTPSDLSFDCMIIGQFTDTGTITVSDPVLRYVNNDGVILDSQNNVGQVVDPYNNTTTDNFRATEIGGIGKNIMVDLKESSAVDYTLEGIFLKAELLNEWRIS